MRRLGLVLLLLGIAGAGALAASVLAEGPPPPTSSQSTDTSTATTATETAPTDTAPAPTTPPPPKRTRLPAGVTVGGVHVGGLTYDAAYAAVRLAFRSPLVLSLGDEDPSISPSRLGVTAEVRAAVLRALHARPGSSVRLYVNVHRPRVAAFVKSLAAHYDRRVADAHVVLRNLRPRVVSERIGRTIMPRRAVAAIVLALQANRRGPIDVPAKLEQPQVRQAGIRSIIVIRRDSKHLYLYRQVKLGQAARFVRRFIVATGQAIYPTPVGSFKIVIKERWPWWYPPPDAPWAKGAKPIPPGPGNPLGTRWMGLSAPGVGIHGTPDPASLGYSASHGCIRMFIPSAEWLFNHVTVGTPVVIVPA